MRITVHASFPVLLIDATVLLVLVVKPVPVSFSILKMRNSSYVQDWFWVEFLSLLYFKYPLYLTLRYTFLRWKLFKSGSFRKSSNFSDWLISERLKNFSVNCNEEGKCRSQRSECGGNISATQKSGLLQCIESGLETKLKFDDKNLILVNRKQDHFYHDNGFFMNGFIFINCISFIVIVCFFLFSRVYSSIW